MQHLPPITEPYDPIQVPYKGGVYGDGDFATYPAHSTPSFDLVRLQNGDPAEHGTDAAAKMLQEWLYFGLLKEALQLEVNVMDFVEQTSIRTADGQSRLQSFITTTKLREYLRRWRAEHEAAKADAGRLARRRDQTTTALQTSHEIWSAFKDFAAITGSEIELSIQLLGSALDHAVTSVSTNAQGDGYHTWISVNEAPWRRTSSPFIEQRMARMGWCPSTIRQLQSPAKLALQAYVSVLRPSFTQDPNVHANCDANATGCAAANIDSNSYITKHVEGCECHSKDPDAFLHVDAEELGRILRRGEIPIVYLDENEGHPRLRLESQRHELQYTAISHVWSDGMGNPQATALPLCQIRKIVHYLYTSYWPLPPRVPPTAYNDSIWNDFAPEVDKDGQDVHKPTFTVEELRSKPLYFWLDTLCVPPPSQDRALRRAAIRNMRAVYYRAMRVIILDAALLATPGTIDTLFAAEIFARILASSWHRRYWTLQEGLLARKAYFRFQDTAFQAIDPPNLLTEHIFSRFFDDEVRYHVDQMDYRLRTRAYAYPYHKRVSTVWSMLNSRVASHKIDESICVATMLDMDTAPLLAIDTGADDEAIAETRLARLWRMYAEFPLGVLCRPALKRDPTQPWAFAKMEDCALIVPPTMVPTVQHDGELSFAHHGFVFAEPLKCTPAGLVAVVIDGETYYVRQNNKNGNEPWSGYEAGEKGMGKIDFEAKEERMAVVLGKDEPGPITACLGALVAVKEVGGDGSEGADGDGDGKSRRGTLEGRYLRAVSVFRKDSVFDRNASPAWSDAETEEKSKTCRAYWTHKDQKWKIRGV